MTEDERPLSAPKGTRDLLPPESWEWQHVVRFALDSFAKAGYAPVETPAFEHTELFERGVGVATEVVGKQMYTFSDRGGRSLTLRPEGTAPVVRAVLEHGLDRGPLPLKLAYGSWMFRQERPQKGRFRHFFQVGIEALGSQAPALDAEVIEVADRYLRDADVDARLLLNSVGHPDSSCRLGYVEVLVEFLERREAELAVEDRERAHVNPLRTFDSKEPQTIAVMSEAPRIRDHLCPPCKEHLGEVGSLLDDLSIDYSIDDRLVRGLDYYTRTAFEFLAPGLGAQSTVCGGGRYDGLSEALGGPPLPGIGFALGIDRLLIARRAERESESEAPTPVEVYVVAVGDGSGPAALALATQLRRAGIGADLDLGGRSMKGQMKDAARSRARWAAIIGTAELAAGYVTLKNLTTGEQERCAVAAVEARVRS